MLERFNAKNLKRGISYLKRNGISSAYYKALERIIRDEAEADYTKIVKDSTLTTEQKIAQRNKEFANPYKISILVPAYNPDVEAFNKLLESVAAQTYTNWELIIADAGDAKSTEDAVRKFTAKHSLDPKGLYDNPDFRKKVVYKHLERNLGISVNTNEALKLATGQYIALLDHDDELTVDALHDVLRALNGNSKFVNSNAKNGTVFKFVYSDEDKVLYDNSSYFDHHKKYDFDPAMILTNNYICHLAVVDTELARSVGGFNEMYDGSQDYDFFLRCIEKIKPEEIVHIHKVLYHWRSSKASTAENPDAKLYAYEAGKKAVKAHLNRIGISAGVENTEHLGFFSVKFPERAASVCVMPMDKFTTLNEQAFDEITTDYIMVLSDDLTGNQDYVKTLQGVMALDFAGAATGKIIKNGKIESAGYNVDKTGGIKACFAGLNKHFSGYLHRASILRCVDAYDRGCVMFKKSALKWNGDGPVLKDGYRCVYVPDAVFTRK